MKNLKNIYQKPNVSTTNVQNFSKIENFKRKTDGDKMVKLTNQATVRITIYGD